MALRPGTRLGAYEIVAPVGVGGMGEVYRARDTRLDRTVAIKVLQPAVAGDPERRERFDREARAIASLSHPHVCALFDVGQQDGTPFLVMEYLDGETLADRLKAGPLPVREALRHGAQIAAAAARSDRLAERRRHRLGPEPAASGRARPPRPGCHDLARLRLDLCRPPPAGPRAARGDAVAAGVT